MFPIALLTLPPSLPPSLPPRGEGRLYEFALQLQMTPRLVTEEMERFLFAVAADASSLPSSLPSLSSALASPPSTSGMVSGGGGGGRGGGGGGRGGGGGGGTPR